ncbi:hypothetical protein DU473_07385 [Campylobacter novaezeelandiae]|uniref:GGDEF domain-containing protein n=1 Tax=Campylobacter novaezeelandiae TaxID=2267891 RepID=A0A4Q9JSQ6_9BACT|nr:hypothetical protein [Campylobacter novaezeelandiae]TBR79131.1 hypothetical protein DU473_07385 [Campylobacter novaezeelandiae]
MFFLEFLSFSSLIFEILALFLSFYFKNTKIFFINFAFIFFKLFYFYASTFQVHLFTSLFLPFIFFILSLKKQNDLIFDKKNISIVVFFLLISILGLVLIKNTEFNASMLNFHLFSFFNPISELSLIFFIFELIFLSFICFKKKEFFYIIAFIGTYIQFLFNSTLKVSYFELSSIVFCIYLLHQTYKNIFFDPLTKFPNEKKLMYFIKGKKEFSIALLHFTEFKFTKESYKKLILKQIAKTLKYLKAKIFIVENDFVFIFKDENTALTHLSYIESLLKNTEICLENEKFKPEFKIFLKNNQNNIKESLKFLREKLP